MTGLEGLSLKSRAVAFTMSAGAVAFTLALLAGARLDGSGDISRAVIVALICGAMCWASAERALAGTAEAIDAATARLAAAAAGDLVSPAPPSITAELPDLAIGLDELFGQMRATLASVNDLAMNDPVTQLPNRRHFRREAERTIDELDEQGRAALLFIDLDRFKAVNDSLGHAVGDRLLEIVAERLRATVAGIDAARSSQDRELLVARLAGDEFTILIPNVTHSTAAAAAAQQVLDVLSEPFALGGQAVEVGASIGVALYPEHGRRLGELMRSADVAMYHAKAQGGRQVQLFTGLLASRQEDRTRREAELRAAIDRNEFTLAFQPQINLATGDVVAAEALLRWCHPEGTRLPASFISVAENSGLIFGIGDWVVYQAVATLARWYKAGFHHRLTLNVSPRQLVSLDFCAHLRSAIVHHGAPTHLLEIEIGEAVAMSCGSDVLDSIAALRDEGVSFAIDNFGSGYSNLVRLKDMPLDRIKLDRALIRDLGQSAQARAIIQSLVGLIHGLGYQAIAEGVETAEQADLLRVVGCDAAQGFGIARPMSDEEYRAWLGKPVALGADAMRAELSRGRAG